MRGRRWYTWEMHHPSRELLKELRRFNWALTVFLFGFIALLLVLCVFFLLPGLDALQNATPEERKTLGATSTLLLAVVLIVLGIGLVLVFRVGRGFYRRRPSAPTPYVDIWAEAGRRAKDEPSDK
jgi:ABC-type Fe3+ transport system permease subunit